MLGSDLHLGDVMQENHTHSHDPSLFSEAHGLYMMCFKPLGCVMCFKPLGCMMCFKHVVCMMFDVCIMFNHKHIIF